MIDRYSLKEMSEIWEPENRFRFMLKVEQTTASVQGDMGIIPKAFAQVILKKAKFSYKNILKREQTTKHDVTAFVDEVSSHLGPAGAYFHYGLTSSDVLDTALSLQIRESAQQLNSVIHLLKKVLKGLAKKHKKDICTGRTHGIHAEPTTFGFKLLGHLSELKRAEESFKQAVEICSVGKMSGAVGAYSSLPPQVESRVCKQLYLKPETLATQTVPRDRLARLVFSLSLIGAFIQRLSVELRHLQRTEVGEVEEGFYKGQAGSSAMPHKKNPISAENLTGISRILRSYVSPALENIILWHERDISHSSVERVILPSSFILSHYALVRLTNLLKTLRVKTTKMKENLESSKGLIFSSQVLNALVQKSCPRKKAYPLIQKISQNLKEEGESFKKALQKHPQIKKYLNHEEIEEIFSGKVLTALLKHFEKTIRHF